MKNDSYSRYIRSDMYKEFLSGTKKKVCKLNIMLLTAQYRESGNNQEEDRHQIELT